jgi:catalase (peroxidase I)
MTIFRQNLIRLDDDKKVSIADLIVLGGCAAIERAAKALVILYSAF